MAPCRTFQPPIVTIATSAALASSSTITVARVACTTGLSRLGCVMVTPGLGSCTRVLDIALMTIHSRAVHVWPSPRTPTRPDVPGYAVAARGRGGIGRHAGLRSRWGKPLGGSSPLARITKNSAQRPDRTAHDLDVMQPHTGERLGLAYRRGVAAQDCNLPRLEAALDPEGRGDGAFAPCFFRCERDGTGERERAGRADCDGVWGRDRDPEIGAQPRGGSASRVAGDTCSGDLFAALGDDEIHGSVGIVFAHRFA